MKKYYVLCTNIYPRKYELMYLENIPTQKEFPSYRYAVGPFRTKRGANYFIDTPNCVSVWEAEKSVGVHRNTKDLKVAAS